VVGDDPLREVAWRLLMRVFDALGDDTGVIRSYHDCERALTQLGTSPSPSTRQLLERLRR
jgi:DNA-binding SARP family transcriptional activator